MGISTIETKRYECDRCGETATFPSNTAAQAAGWSLVTRVTSFEQSSALCPVDDAKLSRFMQGERTGAGAQFNEHEDERWIKSCGG